MEVEFNAGNDPTKATQEASGRALLLAAEYVLQQANRAVPIEEGTLQRSGQASVDDDGQRAAVTYDTSYAVRQHEGLAYRHNDGRTAKWLENALTDSQEQVRAIIADALRGAL